METSQDNVSETESESKKGEKGRGRGKRGGVDGGGKDGATGVQPPLYERDAGSSPPSEVRAATLTRTLTIEVRGGGGNAPRLGGGEGPRRSPEHLLSQTIG